MDVIEPPDKRLRIQDIQIIDQLPSDLVASVHSIINQHPSILKLKVTSRKVRGKPGFGVYGDHTHIHKRLDDGTNKPEQVLSAIHKWLDQMATAGAMSCESSDVSCVSDAVSCVSGAVSCVSDGVSFVGGAVSCVSGALQLELFEWGCELCE